MSFWLEERAANREIECADQADFDAPREDGFRR
jgi:hypothetical protein